MPILGQHLEYACQAEDTGVQEAVIRLAPVLQNCTGHLGLQFLGNDVHVQGQDIGRLTGTVTLSLGIKEMAIEIGFQVRQ